MNNFVMGLNAMALLVAGLFFLRFWRQTRDRLFLTFALAFWLLVLTRVGLVMRRNGFLVPQESDTLFYLLRLGAYLLIIWAIVDKNVHRGTPEAQPPEG
jgi:hypothetical protein